MRSLAYALSAFGCLLLTPCLGAQELVTDRPDQTESTATIAPGRLQIETGATRTEESDGSETDELGSTLLRIGLLENLELRLGWQGQVRATASGARDVEGSGDSEIGLKYRLRPVAGFDSALLLSAALPTGSGPGTSDDVLPEVRWLLSRDLSDRLGLGTNLGVGRGEGSDSTYFVYTQAAGWGLTDRLSLFVEAFGEIPLEAGSPAHSVDGGLTYLLTPRLQLDLAVGAGLSEAAPDAFWGVGVSLRLPG